MPKKARQVRRNIAPAHSGRPGGGLPPFIVTLAGYGNVDYRQGVNKPICRPAEGIVKSLEDGKGLVRHYIGENDLGGGNWYNDAGEVHDSEGIYVGRYSYNGRFWPVSSKDGYGLPYEFSLPHDISQLGAEAAIVIATTLAEHQALFTGGCRPFWAPEEWLKRGNKYCVNSELIILHDGGGLSAVFGQFEEPYTKIVRELAEKKLYVEGCTSVYSAVFPIEPIKLSK
jgi:hypothetical protein